MRRLLTLLLLFFSLSVFGQLRGTFCSQPDFTGYCITFKNESLFDFSAWNCKGGEKGSGTYVIINKTLSLNFTSEDTLKYLSENLFTIKDTICNEADSISLAFSVVDRRTNEPIPSALILLMKLSNDTIGALTDLNGKALLKIKKSDREFRITSPNVGYKLFSLRTKADNCKDITINLAPILFETIVEKGTKMEFEIKKEEHNKLILRQDKFDLVFTRMKK